MSLTSDLRRLQKRALGGRVVLVLDQTGEMLHGAIYPARADAEVWADEDSKAYTSVERSRRVEEYLAEPLFSAKGTTLGEVLSLLGKEVADDAIPE